MRVIAAGAMVMACACAPDDTAVGDGGDTGPTTTASSSGGVGEGVTSSTGTGADETTAAPSADSSGESTSTGDEITGEASSTGEPVAGCGDGVLDPDEGCDDGNRVDGDGCDPDCVPADAVVWTVQYDGPAGDSECATRVVATADGIWLAGAQRNAEGISDGWLGRLDHDGQWAWHADYAGPGDDRDEATGLAVDEAGHAWVTGWFTQNGRHPWVWRVDPDGGEVWASTWSDGLPGEETPTDLALVDGAPWIAVRRYDQPSVMQRWSALGELSTTVDLVSDQAFEIRDLALGPDAMWLFASAVDPFEPIDRPAALRLGADGQIAAQIVVDTPSTSGQMSGSVGPDGTLVVVSYDEPAGGETPTVRLWDPDGVLLDAWLVELDGAPGVSDVALTDEGDVVLAGARHGVPWARRTDAGGAAIWDRIYTAPEELGAIHAIALAPDGDVVAAGCVGLDVFGDADVWVRRFAP